MTTPAHQPGTLGAWLRIQLDAVAKHRAETLKVMAHVLPPEPAEYLTEVADMLLAEVDAKRRILDEVVDEATGLDMQVDSEFRVGRRDTAAEPYLGDVLRRLLALPFAGHPDYREEFRP